MSSIDEQLNGLEVAVIALNGQFPGAKSVDELWQNLVAAKESVSFFSDEELLEAGVEQSLLDDPNYVKANALIDDPYVFDNRFFDYQDREAQLMDPQLRLLHQCIWQLFEHAGYALNQIDQRVGLFVGATDNLLWLSKVLGMVNNDAVALFEADTIFKKDYFATRLAYKLNLKGPAVNVQTACSTSLVAIHMAVQNLLNGDCDMAVAAGASVQPKKEGYLYQPGMIMSPDGHCRPFDADAQGIVGGEGVAAVMLKRLEDAQDDGDEIFAVIKGSAFNNDGNDKVGFTAPSVQGQVDVITSALEMAEVDPKTITYIECHGTGTQLGDPIEIQALSQVFAGVAKQHCRIGSLKSNIGHLDAAAGIASFIKTVMCLRHQQLPASLHFKQSNPNIPLEQTPFRVNSELTEWRNDEAPLRAGVSSFGIGGTNAHVILEQYVDERESGSSRPWQLLPFSAKRQSTLQATQAAVLQQLDDQSLLADVSYTLQTGRVHFDHRQAMVVGVEQSINDVSKGQYPSQLLAGKTSADTKPQLVFMFPGQGSQYAGMAHELYHTEAVFKQSLDQCFEVLDALGLVEIKAALLATSPEPQANQLLAQTAYTQPTLFAVEYALAQQLISWGIEPDCMIGHSIGEYVAACVAGVFSLTDGLKLVATRGKLMAECEAGAMLSVSLNCDDLASYLDGGTVDCSALSIAAANSSEMSVVSGTTEQIQNLMSVLNAAGHKCGLLHTSHAFHSQMMRPIIPKFIQAFNGITLQSPERRYVSNVTGDWISADQATSAQYWAEHLLSTVAFSQGLDTLLANSNALLVEVGPSHTLSSFVRRHQAKQSTQQVVNTLPHPKETHGGAQQLTQAIAALYVCGVDIDWSLYRQGELRKRIPLAGYAFEPRRFEPSGNSQLLQAQHFTDLVQDGSGDDEGQYHARPDIMTVYVAPQTEIQQQLADIWQSLFKIEQVGINDNFFDLGGHSLLSVRLISYIEKALHCKFTPEQVFNMNTILAQSEYIQQKIDMEQLQSSLALEDDELEEIEI